MMIRRLVFGLVLMLCLHGAAAAVASPPASSQYPFENTPNPGIPTLQEITAGATTDAEALQMVKDYYYGHVDWLSQVLGEDNPQRLLALYVMYVVHISHIYGETTVPPTLIDYLNEPYSHCGVYTVFQAEILDSFGMTWRVFADDIVEHAWMEVQIDGKWEVFDATVNVWMDQNSYDLLKGVPRNFRTFYTPMNDITRPDARQHYWIGPAANHIVGWYNMPRLRVWMTELGLAYNPPTPADKIGISASVPGQGSHWNQPWIPGTYVTY